MCAALLLGNAAVARAATPAPAPTRHATAQPNRTDHTTAVASPSVSATPSPAGNGSWTVQDAIRFWTPQRMASATDPSGRIAQPQGWTAPRRKQSVATGINGEHFDSIKCVGTLFTTTSDMPITARPAWYAAQGAT